MNNGMLLNGGGGSLRRNYVPNSAVVLRDDDRLSVDSLYGGRSPSAASPDFRRTPSATSRRETSAPRSASASRRGSDVSTTSQKGSRPRTSTPSYLRSTQSSQRKTSQSADVPLRREAMDMLDAGYSSRIRDDDEWSIASSVTSSTATSRRILRSTHRRMMQELPQDETRERGRIEALEDYSYIMILEDFHEEVQIVMETTQQKVQQVSEENLKQTAPEITVEPPHEDVVSVSSSEISDVSFEDVNDTLTTDKVTPINHIDRLCEREPSQQPTELALPVQPPNVLSVLESVAAEAQKREQEASVVAAEHSAHLQTVRFLHQEVRSRIAIVDEESKQRELMTADYLFQSSVLGSDELQRLIVDRTALESSSSPTGQQQSRRNALLEQQMNELVEDNKKLLLSLASAQRDIARLSSQQTQAVVPLHPALAVHDRSRAAAEVSATVESGAGQVARSLFALVSYPFRCCQRPPPPSAQALPPVPAPNVPHRSMDAGGPTSHEDTTQHDA